MLQVQPPTLENFLCRIEEGYCKFHNPYHNNLHAADVAQTVHYMLCQTGLMVCTLIYTFTCRTNIFLKRYQLDYFYVNLKILNYNFYFSYKNILQELIFILRPIANNFETSTQCQRLYSPETRLPFQLGHSDQLGSLQN